MANKRPSREDAMLRPSRENAMRLPSGDHAAWTSPTALFVSRTRWPPFGSIEKISASPSRVVVKAIREPSGDHAGSEFEAPGELVIRTAGPEPSAGLTKISSLPVRSLLNAIIE